MQESCEWLCDERARARAAFSSHTSTSTCQSAMRASRCAWKSSASSSRRACTLTTAGPSWLDDVLELWRGPAPSVGAVARSPAHVSVGVVDRDAFGCRKWFHRWTRRASRALMSSSDARIQARHSGCGSTESTSSP